jgi:hypothetical protein
LYFESFWKGLHPVDWAKPCGLHGIIKQEDSSIDAQQTGVVIQEHIDAKSWSESGTTTEKNMRQCTERLHT